jgi:hypothetical protein
MTKSQLQSRITELETLAAPVLDAWVSFYNLLIQREDTNWPEGEKHQHTPLTPIPEP